jgi:peptidoglycan/LPS O-acetylase OafA/YrhL
MEKNRLLLAQTGGNISFLDGLRGFAVSFVLLYHFLPKTLSVKFNSTLLTFWDTFWLMGWAGVDLFFVLSGFLITGILYKTKGQSHYFKNFYIRRFLRIFPAYYLLIVFAIFYFPEHSVSAWYWLYFSNFDIELGIPFHPILCVAWSLAIEEQYYLVYPSIVYFLNDKKWILFLTVLIFISVFVRFSTHYFDMFVPRQMYHNTFAHFDGIALGGLIRMLLFNYEKYKGLIKWYVKLTPVFILLSIGLSYYCGMIILGEFIETRKLEHVSFLPPMYLFGYFINAVTFGGIILSCIFIDGILLKIFSNPILRNIGKYSYAMYLFQYPAKYLLHGIFDVINVNANNFNQIIHGLLIFGTCYLIARISWLIYEGPINSLKNKFSTHS